MYQEQEDRFYYLTIYNENYPCRRCRRAWTEGILKGIYRFQARGEGGKARVQLFGSGPILNEALRAQKILAEKYGVAADVWSVTSYNELYRDAIDRSLEQAASRRNSTGAVCQSDAEGAPGVLVAASDYMNFAESIGSGCRDRWRRWGPTDFGRSETRRRCAISLKWMRSTSCWPRARRWRGRSRLRLTCCSRQ